MNDPLHPSQPQVPPQGAPAGPPPAAAPYGGAQPQGAPAYGAPPQGAPPHGAPSYGAPAGPPPSAAPSPYAAPESLPSANEPDMWTGYDAPQGKRFANMIVDLIAYTVMMFVVGLIGGAIGGYAFVDMMDDPVLGNLFSYGLYFAYFVGFEATLGRTPGKFVTGTKVVNATGDAPSFGQVLGRTATRFVPFEAFSFLSSNPRGWHDKWSNTHVVTTR